MSRTVVSLIKCDICSAELELKQGAIDNIKKDVQVVFTTEQTEGKNTTPYLRIVTIDLCDGCYSKILDGNMPFAAGAMGYNNYWFKNREKG